MNLSKSPIEKSPFLGTFSHTGSRSPFDKLAKKSRRKRISHGIFVDNHVVQRINIAVEPSVFIQIAKNISG